MSIRPRRILQGLRRLTLDEHNDLPTAWAADNKSVIFFSDRNGLANIFRQSVDETDAEALTSGPEYKWGPRLSADGKSIHYLSSPSPPYTHVPRASLMRIALSGGAPQVIAEGRRHGRPPMRSCAGDSFASSTRYLRGRRSGFCMPTMRNTVEAERSCHSIPILMETGTCHPTGR